ncbi:MAG: helix-turn-helix transcriptional regulator [Paenibacillus sp.]|uniref:helix-turn-helix domain-containing protein n=1 Tax=Paenibacillus sp. TaxID=58172 RepID=UPI0028FE87B6|nr:helix-turn-helix transcriptional regulator [Paenibacillus sp.]MDU2239373.1 helix-turn-helix transcriptional regulator [Paenibacillus sp.]
MAITRGELHKIRKALGLTLDEMGALMNVSGPHLHYIEKGSRPLRIEQVAMLTREIDLTPERLVSLIAAYDAADTAKELARQKLVVLAR